MLKRLQHKRILEMTVANDAPIVWLLRHAFNFYLENQGEPPQGSDVKTCPYSGSDV